MRMTRIIEILMRTCQQFDMKNTKLWGIKIGVEIVSGLETFYR